MAGCRNRLVCGTEVNTTILKFKRLAEMLREALFFYAFSLSSRALNSRVMFERFCTAAAD